MLLLYSCTGGSPFPALQLYRRGGGNPVNLYRLLFFSSTAVRLYRSSAWQQVLLCTPELLNIIIIPPSTLQVHHSPLDYEIYKYSKLFQYGDIKFNRADLEREHACPSLENICWTSKFKLKVWVGTKFISGAIEGRELG